MKREKSQHAGPSEEKKLTARIYTADRVKSTNKQLYLNIDSIREAIDSGKKVQFQYYDYSPDKQRILRHDGEIYVNSPYVLLRNYDRYYMLGYSEKHQKVVSFRIDRMLKVKVTEEDQIPSQKDFSAASYAKKVIKIPESRSHDTARLQGDKVQHASGGKSVTAFVKHHAECRKMRIWPDKGRVRAEAPKE